MYRTIVRISGMACGMCEAHINDAVHAVFPVKKVTSSRKKGETVILAETPPDAEQLKQVIAAAGYEALDVTTAPCEKRGLFRR